MKRDYDVDKKEYENEKKELVEQLNQLKQQFLALKEQSADVFDKDTKNIKTQLQDLYNIVKEKTDKGLGELKENIADYSNDLHRKWEKLSDNAQERVQRNPVESLFGVGLVGLLVGFIIGKKN